jgi:uncharacterized protein
MRIVKLSHDQCKELLSRASLARLACSLNNKPYVIPVCFAYEPDCIYVFSTVGKKIEWMRQNPQVCLQVDELERHSNWNSVVVEGTYVELREPQYTAEKEHAKELLSQMADWWLLPLAERREQMDDVAIELVFFRIDIQSISGLRGIPENA